MSLSVTHSCHPKPIFQEAPYQHFTTNSCCPCLIAAERRYLAPTQAQKHYAKGLKKNPGDCCCSAGHKPRDIFPSQYTPVFQQQHGRLGWVCWLFFLKSGKYKILPASSPRADTDFPTQQQLLPEFSTSFALHISQNLLDTLSSHQ